MPRIHLLTPPDGTQSQHEEAELREQWEQGLIPDGAQYWKEGMPAWRPISELVGEAALDTNPSAPPPSGYFSVRDPLGVTGFLVVMLWAHLAAETLLLISNLAKSVLLSGPYTQSQGEMMDLIQMPVGGFYLVVVVITTVTFLYWMRRANINCRTFGAVNMKFSPGWSIGYFFIPILSIYKPFHAMSEIWRASHDPSNWETRPIPALLRWWWGLFLLSGFTGNLSFRLELRAETVPDLQAATSIAIASGVLGIPLCLVALRIVTTIAARQRALANAGVASTG